MRTKAIKNITIDPEVWEKAGEMLKAVGLNRSAFIEITFRSFVRLDKVPVAEAMQGVMTDLFDSQKKIKPKKKKDKG